jgi:FLYWCH zinc finger domain
LFILELIKLKYAAFDADERLSQKESFWSFIRSQRGAPLIIRSDYVYRCERKIGSKTYWLCIRYKGHKCNARLILTGNQICKETEHNHVSDNRSSEEELELKNLEDDDIDDWIKGNNMPKKRN